MLGCFGFLAPIKNVGLLVQTLKQLPDNYKLLWVGGFHPTVEAAYKQEVLTLIQENNLEERFLITGAFDLEELPAFYQLVDCCIASHNETFRSGSASINNALASGKPVIASNVLPFLELACLYEPCLIYKNEEEDSLRDTVLTLANDRNLYDTIAANAKHFCEIVTWETMAERYLTGLGLAKNEAALV